MIMLSSLVVNVLLDKKNKKILSKNDESIIDENYSKP
jgi:hypothetical protein